MKTTLLYEVARLKSGQYRLAGGGRYADVPRLWVLAVSPKQAIWSAANLRWVGDIFSTDRERRTGIVQTRDEGGRFRYWDHWLDNSHRHEGIFPSGLTPLRPVVVVQDAHVASKVRAEDAA